jgi:hypothetical protein
MPESRVTFAAEWAASQPCFGRFSPEAWKPRTRPRYTSAKPGRTSSSTSPAARARENAAHAASAEELLNLILGSDPENEAALEMLANFTVRQSEGPTLLPDKLRLLDQAADLYARIIVQNPRNAAAHYKRATAIWRRFLPEYEQARVASPMAAGDFGIIRNEAVRIDLRKRFERRLIDAITHLYAVLAEDGSPSVWRGIQSKWCWFLVIRCWPRPLSRRWAATVGSLRGWTANQLR